jgi:pimeloyl-ACP methyl ester carboxylesterase
MAATVCQVPSMHTGQPYDRNESIQPPIIKQLSDSSNSDDDLSAPLTSSQWLESTEPNDAESVIGVSISRAQTRLASARTPAIEKEAAIKRGGGYFSLDGVIAEANGNSPSDSDSEFSLGQSGDGQATSRRKGVFEEDNEADASTHEPSLFSNQHFETSDSKDLSLQPRAPRNAMLSPRRSNSVSTTASGVKEFHYRPLHSQRPLPSVRRASSEGSLSIRRALSTASSLGDDTRFENVREQVNSRFKAIKDSFQDTTFRLPQMPNLPKFPNIMSVVTKLPPKEEDSRGLSSPQKLPVKETMLESIRKRTSSFPKPLAPKQDNVVIPSAQLNTSFISSHPYFTRALQDLKGDLIVMGGYRGSILRSASPPHQRAWIPLKAGFNLAKVDLEVGLKDEDEDQMVDSIYPDGMLTHIGPVDISRRLFKKLRAAANVQNGKLRVHNYGYDWRLSPDKLSKQLLSFVEHLPCNSKETPVSQRGVWVLAHSLGGLITRHAVNQRPEFFRGVVYAGTPNTCVNILGPLRNGDDVLFNSKILTAQVNFTIRTSFALLPLDGRCFVDETTKKELPVDFFNAQDWIKYELSPCVALPKQPNNNKTGIMDTFPQSMSRSIGDVIDNIQSFGRRASIRPKQKSLSDGPHLTNNTASNQMGEETGMTPQMSSNNREGRSGSDAQSRPSTTTTIPHPMAVEYLTRILASVKKFKIELAPIESHTKSNSYPPAAVIYGKTEPTVCAARVNGYQGIVRPDVYDNLAFASGDGVVLARAAMLPDGYKAVKGGVIGSDRGHITLLGDLEAVGRAFVSVMRARSQGVGIGPPSGKAENELDGNMTTSSANI